MKIFHISCILASVFADKAQNGWQIECRVDSGDKTDPLLTGPAYLNSNRLFDNQLNLYWSTHSIDYNAILGTGPFGTSGDDNACESTNNSTVLLVDEPTINWPNEIDEVPVSVFGKGYMQIPSGFAVPFYGISDGCIAIANMNADLPVDINNIQILTGGCGLGRIAYKRYFYHYAKWFDMDNDGDLDLITARSQSPIDQTNPSIADLVWFENEQKGFMPGNDTLNGVWKSYVINGAHNLADKYLDIWTDDKKIYIITGGFASQKLVLLSGTDWKYSSDVDARVVDNDGRYYSQRFVDLNLDGVLDVVVTIASADDKTGQLVVYPGQYSQSSGYTLGNKITVYDQFPVFNSKALGSPAGAVPFWNGEEYKGKGVLPSLLISGDDDGNLYLAVPDVTGAKFNFQYTVSSIYQTSIYNPFITRYNAPTTGKPAIVDVNGDGCYEIAVAGFAIKEVVILSQTDLSECKRSQPTGSPTLPPKPTAFPTHRP